jgi:hypothetical protein
MKQENYFHETYTFTPRTNRTTQDKPSVYKFFNRLQQWKDKMNEKHEINCEKSMRTEDGAPLFQPKILPYSSNSDGRDVFDKLYNFHKFKKEKEKQNQEIYNYEIQQLSQTKLSTVRSNKLYEKMKVKCFEVLFEILNNDNIISYSEEIENILNSFNEDICNYMRPLLDELKDQNETLNRDEFILAMNHLFDILNISERKNFIDVFNKREEKIEINENLTFHPKINSHSKRLK